ncbi:MAG: hypothetical protein M3T56_12390 [Chloroflexota bacterium]|nr:hypothetical protein [Chloroflexota bacterium]
MSAVASRADACGTMDIDSHVALVAARRPAGVDSHANAYDAAGKSALSLFRSGDGIAGLAESHEERVPLVVDLDPVMGREGRAQRAPVFSEYLRVGRAELSE